MGIKRYYNRIVKNARSTDEARTGARNYRKDISRLVSPGSRFIYAGNLTGKGLPQLLDIFLKENIRNDEDVVIGIEGKRTPQCEEFIEHLPDNMHAVLLPGKAGKSVADAAMTYLYNSHGIRLPMLNKYYQKLADKQLNVLPCDKIEFLATDYVEIIESFFKSDKKVVWHKVPTAFYSKIGPLMYSHPEIVSDWEEGFDEVVRYDQDYAYEVWDTEFCEGIRAEMRELKLYPKEDTTTLTGKIFLSTNDENAVLEPRLVIGSKIYDGAFEYEAECRLVSKKYKNGVADSCYKISAVFPNEEIATWYNGNNIFVRVATCGHSVKVPVMRHRGLNVGMKKLYDVPNTGRVCEIVTQFRHYKLCIRDKLVTDGTKEKIKLCLAFGSHLVTPWNKPILLYEKNCRGYEESASAVFEKLVDQGNKNVRFVLNREVRETTDIEDKYRKKIVDQFSFGHYYNLFAARSILSSEAIGHAIEKGTNNWLFKNMIEEGHKNYVFLQHGVMYMVSLSAEQRNFFNKRSGRGLQKVVVSSHLEAEHFTDNTDYKPEDIYISGLPKFDNSTLNEDADRISIMLTWRPWDAVIGMTDIKQTGYYRMLKDIVKNIPDKLRDKLIVMPHPLILKQVENDPDDDVWKYFRPGLKYEEMLKNTRVLITDYSSISYDAFYRGSNVIFCWEEKDFCMSNYGKNARLMLTEQLAFGDVCYKNSELGDVLLKAYEKEQDDEYIKRYSKVVEFRDGKNTERLIEMLERDGIIGSNKSSLKHSSYIGRLFGKIRRIRTRKKTRAIQQARSAYPSMLEEPLKEKAILFEARNGKEIDGNIYYLLKEVLTNPDYDAYEIYLSVASSDIEGLIDLKFAHINTDRINTVIVDSADWFRAFATCKYIISDATIKNFFVKREGQIFLDVWHGTPFKVMGKKVAHEPHAIGNAQKNFVVADFLLYPNEYMMEHMIEDYMIHNISKANILLSGYPRNSAFFDDKKRAEIREEMGFGNRRTYVYMPTWRPEIMGFSTEDVLRRFDAQLRDDEIMFAKIHPLAADNIDFSAFNKVKKYPGNYETYEFLNAVDCLITDYSSVFYDYAVTGRNIILYTYDEEEYFKTRGVYEPLSTLPFTKVKSEEEALIAARSKKTYDDTDFIRRFCSLESGNAAEKLCRRVILGIKSDDIDEREMPDNRKDNVIIKAGGLQPGPRTDRAMEFLAKLDPKEANYYLFFKRNEIKENWNILFDVPEGINFYGCAGKSFDDENLEQKRVFGDMRISKEIVIS